MRINQDYLRTLLQVCQTFEKPTFTITDLQASGLNYNDMQFEFHMGILNDQGFIVRDDGDAGFGLFKSADGFSSWAALPLRLTASGHSFIEALSHDEIWAAIKRDFADAGIATMNAASLKLLDRLSHTVVNNVVNNTTNIETATHSLVQQAGAHSRQGQHVRYSTQDLGDLDRLMNELSNNIHDLNLDDNSIKRAKAQIATIRAQLGDEPNPIILEQAGRTLRNITEGAIASLIGAAVQPTVWTWAFEIMKRLFS